MHAARGNWLVQVNIPITDLDVKTTIWVSADPGLVVNRRSLTTVVRERHQLADVAL
jgi:hypothetical protein